MIGKYTTCPAYILSYLINIIIFKIHLRQLFKISNIFVKAIVIFNYEDNPLDHVILVSKGR